MVSYRAPNVNSERRKTWGLSRVQPLDFIPAPAACTPERMKPFRVLHAEKTRKSGGLPLSWHANAPAERTAGAFVKPDALHFRYDTNFAEDRNFVIFAFERLYDADNHDDEPGDQADNAH